jgi:hypothetical protein
MLGEQVALLNNLLLPCVLEIVTVRCNSLIGLRVGGRKQTYSGYLHLNNLQTYTQA